MKSVPLMGFVAGLIGAVVMTSGGCSSSTSGGRQWEGHRISEVVARDGPADRIMAYPYGGTLYIWEAAETHLQAADASTFGNAPQIESLVRRRIFLVNDAGVITRAQFETMTGGPLGTH